MEEVVSESEVIVIGNGAPEFRQVLQHVGRDQVIVDLVRILNDDDQLDARYEGICW
jgi:GDP-mannose 6-dehydrogenase